MKIVYQGLSQIYQPSPLDAFLEIPPLAKEAYSMALRQIEGKKYPREELYQILKDYNLSIQNNSAEVLDNLENFKDLGSYCVITGQQLGLMGGPAYTILKALTTLQLAKKYRAIPVFWLATEDHDQQEIDHTYLLDHQGNIENYRLKFPHDGRMVEDLILNLKQQEILKELSEVTGCPLPFSNHSYSSLMISVLRKLFEGTGLIFVEPRILRKIALPFFLKEIDKTDQISTVLKKTTEQLLQSGGERILDLDNPTNLFFKNEKGFRFRIKKENGLFRIENEFLTKEQLSALASENPDRLSTNAASRPVLQSHLFPTLAYVAGPSEMQYYRQLKDYHTCHNVAMPWIYPRCSGTMISPTAAHYLSLLNLQPWDTLDLAWSAYIPEMVHLEENLKAKWAEAALQIIPQGQRPPQLEPLIEHSVRKIQKRVLKKHLNQHGIPSFALHYLRNLIRPHKKPQERIFNWFEHQRQSKSNLIKELLEQLNFNNQDHFYCYYD